MAAYLQARRKIYDLSIGANPRHRGFSAQSSLKSEASPSSEVEVVSSRNSKSPMKSFSKAHLRSYPLYPSIVQILHENGLAVSEANKIPASGPKGRLLKGDVLAYLGKISPSYSSEQSARISKLGHLDLGDIKVAPLKHTPRPPPRKEQSRGTPLPNDANTEITIPISLSSVLSVQKRIQTTLGVTLPLSTFIARATELANNDLPRSANEKLTAGELYESILGLNTVPGERSRAQFVPQITPLPKKSFNQTESFKEQVDIYDLLTGTAEVSNVAPEAPIHSLRAEEVTNVLRVSAPRGKEKGARTFLERVKTLLQLEPGRLIL